MLQNIQVAKGEKRVSSFDHSAGAPAKSTAQKSLHRKQRQKDKRKAQRKAIKLGASEFLLDENAIAALAKPEFCDFIVRLRRFLEDRGGYPSASVLFILDGSRLERCDIDLIKGVMFGLPVIGSEKAATGELVGRLESE